MQAQPCGTPLPRAAGAGSRETQLQEKERLDEAREGFTALLLEQLLETMKFGEPPQEDGETQTQPSVYSSTLRHELARQIARQMG